MIYDIPRLPLDRLPSTFPVVTIINISTVTEEQERSCVVPSHLSSAVKIQPASPMPTKATRVLTTMQCSEWKCQSSYFAEKVTVITHANLLENIIIAEFAALGALGPRLPI